MTDQKAFFGYPSYPSTTRETVSEGARKVAATGIIGVETWEELRVAGQLIIDRVLQAIDECTVACFDVTTLNHNVLFELGYAIGSEKLVWPLFDRSDAEATYRWQRLRLLTTVGYTPYTNSDDIRAAFLSGSPQLQDETIFHALIEPNLQPQHEAAIFYLPSNHQTDASRELTRRIHKEAVRGQSSIEADPTEASVYPLSWYAQQIYASTATIAHFSAPRRFDAEIHNARSALICGLARGMGKPLLILAEEDYLAPIDYRDLVYVYGTARQAVEYADRWLSRHLVSQTPAPQRQTLRAASITLSTELKSIRFGQPVAENEAVELSNYFVDTPAFDEVLERKTTVFIGRKGSGKTANFLRAAEILSDDARNLVCVIKPYGYELEAIVSVLKRLEVGDAKNFAIEALWQYLLYTEIARVAAAAIRNKPAGPVPASPEWQLLSYVDDLAHGINQDFSVRLERAVKSVTDVSIGEGVEENRAHIAAALHAGVIQELRSLLGMALSDRARVCVLIDNLDKAWERTSDLDQLAHILLGLLTAVGRVDLSFGKRDSWRRPVDVTLAVFLRSDIFDKILEVAREPDKIPISRIAWEDRNLLLRVIEERYRSTHPTEKSTDELWDRFFTPTIRTLPTRDYLLFRILPRPRDLVQICSFALNAAVNARHEVIDEMDIIAAEKFYSQFAFEALLVENGLSIDQLEAILFEFAGSSAVVDHNLVEEFVMRAGIGQERVSYVITRLRELSFLGVQVREGVFSYAERGRDFRKVD